MGRPWVGSWSSIDTRGASNIAAPPRPRGSAREANPVLRGIVGAPAGLIALKAGTTAGLIHLTEKMWKRNPTLAILTMIGVNGAHLAVVSHNYSAVR